MITAVLVVSGVLLAAAAVARICSWVLAWPRYINWRLARAGFPFRRYEAAEHIKCEAFVYVDCEGRARPCP